VRFAVPIGAAALVIAVVATAAFLLRHGGAGTAAPQPVGAESATTPAPQYTKEHRLNQGTASAEAVAALHQLAQVAASTQPQPLASGQLIYVRSEGWAAGFDITANGDRGAGIVRPEVHQMWVDPQGMIALKIVVNGEDYTASGPKSNHPGEVEGLRKFLAENGPSLQFPTPRWLEQLPTDPDQLLAALRATADPSSPWSDDHQVVDGLRHLLWNADAVLPTDLRVALYGAMAKLTGLTAKPVTIDGRALVAIRHAEGNDTTEILFDPATGHAVGVRSLLAPDSGITQPPVPGDDQNVTYQSLWTQTVVDEVDQTS